MLDSRYAHSEPDNISEYPNSDPFNAKIFAAAGYNGLVTSYFAMRYMLEHSGIDPDRLTIKNYPGGHMMDLQRPSQEALSNDIVKFIEAGGAR